MQVLGIKTGLIRVGDDLAEVVEKGLAEAGLCLQDGDVLVISESALATAEGSVVDLKGVVPTRRAETLARRYCKDPAEMEMILQESDELIGGIPGVVLTLKDGFLFPNAGLDRSNAPHDCVVLLPKNPCRSAQALRDRLSKGKRVAVIIGDSRTHPLRLGCVGVALACAGLEPVEDARGQRDLFGRELKITRKAVADNLVSAAQIVMGEGDEGIPAVMIRGAPVRLTDEEASCIPSIPPQECMYIGVLRGGMRPYQGGRDELISAARGALQEAYAPYSGFRVGAALLAGSGRIYTAGNVENASSGAGICAERAAVIKAISSGEREMAALAVVGDTEEPITPCGICRQMLVEFGSDIEVVMVNRDGRAVLATAAELLPSPFSREAL
ncbi:MAG TPA: coenzyme F420-0:L-glutamate ligase [Methanotrichaceae archaeon]|nr:coenzyme F420-0:L-glutamate ligase [Methanotrichaceae archaeon]HQI90465.1 coenzyme F420-0:L-glutamate ligase [Methanotrichaceae archaeon]HQJ28146.1 coenzyme F420-0:L-glutamate ligase [Methanotrichaceae archaeon]